MKIPKPISIVVKKRLWLFTVFQICVVSVVLCFSCNWTSSRSPFSLVLVQAGKLDVELIQFPAKLDSTIHYSKTVDNIKIDVVLEAINNYTFFKAIAKTSSGDANVYLALKSKYRNAVPWNYDGEVLRTEIFRQSPHDVNAWICDSLAKQSIPMIGFREDTTYVVAVSNSPVYFNNYTTQEYNLEKKELYLASGDNGRTPGMKPESAKLGAYNAEKGQKFSLGKVEPYYHPISALKTHVFDGFILKSTASNLNNLRKDIITGISTIYSKGKYVDYMGALAFSVPYMNLRINDTQKSDVWVVPSVEYANIQYCRDAFWISTMLADSLSEQCLKNELDSVNHYAEYPLYIPIWAYRTIKEGGTVDLLKVQRYIDVIEQHVRDGFYYSYDCNDGRKDFQYWNDMIAFDTTDVISYNQGLLAVALMSAKAMGLKTITSPEIAISNYRSLYDHKRGFFPISKLKTNILSPDPLVGDLLAYVYHDKHLLDKNMVENHYTKIVQNSKTKFGYKIVSNIDGSYLQASDYDVEGYISQANKEGLTDGKYQKGGSWTLYDMLFLTNCFAHGIQGAEDELIWRASLDFKIGATSYECINTITGEPWKPNMGWNSAIYRLWSLITNNISKNKLFQNIHLIVEDNKPQ
jgi:hypothetical protein